MRTRFMTALVAVGIAAAMPLTASASVVCNSNLFSSIQSPLTFASQIEGAFTPSTTQTQTSTGTNASTSTQTCLVYVPAGMSAVCAEYQVTTTGTTAGAATGTSQTVTAGEQAMADAQKLVMQYQQLQAKMCSLASLNGMAFSAWPSQAQSVIGMVESLQTGNDTSPTDAAAVMSQLQSQQANNASQLSYITNTLAPNVTGETSATEVNTALLELLASQQQQQMEEAANSGVQFQTATMPMAPAMMGSMFDVNEAPDAGWHI